MDFKYITEKPIFRPNFQEDAFMVIWFLLCQKFSEKKMIFPEEIWAIIRWSCCDQKIIVPFVKWYTGDIKTIKCFFPPGYLPYQLISKVPLDASLKLGLVGSGRASNIEFFFMGFDIVMNPTPICDHWIYPICFNDFYNKTEHELECSIRTASQFVSRLRVTLYSYQDCYLKKIFHPLKDRIYGNLILVCRKAKCK